MREELLKGLTEEQIAKVNECNNAEEILALAKEEGVTLSDEQLEAVSGGGCSSTRKCPMCGSTNIKRKTENAAIKTTKEDAKTVNVYVCKDCKHTWFVG